MAKKQKDRCIRHYIKHDFVTFETTDTHHIQRCTYCKGLNWRMRRGEAPERTIKMGMH